MVDLFVQQYCKDYFKGTQAHWHTLTLLTGQWLMSALMLQQEEGARTSK